MRCRAALERMASLPDEGHFAKDPELSAHVAACAACARSWREHRALLGLLASPGETPPFDDLTAGVLARLDGPRSRRSSWQWVAAAALALMALGLGYLFGQISASPAQPSDSMAATYQAAFTGQAAGSAELAYLEAGSTASARSTP